ncbi:MAG: LytTR family DNA-binding domain-containing protein [Clostridia bacterium]
MKIAICEDDGSDRDLLHRQLAQAIQDLNVNAEVEAFQTAEQLLKAAEKTYFSIFFLDILLPGLSGMDAALKLRQLGNYAPVIFTTVTRDYLAQSYTVWAVHYLVKPIEESEIKEALSRALRVLDVKEKTLEITVARHTEYIPYSDIYYIEGNNRNCLVHTRTGTYNPYNSVQGMFASLNDSRFCHSHRSYVINLDHVLTVLRGKVAMRDDALLPIRRGADSEVRRAWEDHRFEVVNGRE